MRSLNFSYKQHQRRSHYKNPDRTEEAETRVNCLAAKLREMGIDPEQV
ncbi:MAG: hypothetical protein ACRAVC_11360 [Trichormus sp.]